MEGESKGETWGLGGSYYNNSSDSLCASEQHYSRGDREKVKNKIVA